MKDQQGYDRPDLPEAAFDGAPMFNRFLLLQTGVILTSLAFAHVTGETPQSLIVAIAGSIPAGILLSSNEIFHQRRRLEDPVFQNASPSDQIFMRGLVDSRISANDIKWGLSMAASLMALASLP